MQNCMDALKEGVESKILLQCPKCGKDTTKASSPGPLPSVAASTLGARDTTASTGFHDYRIINKIEALLAKGQVYI